MAGTESESSHGTAGTGEEDDAAGNGARENGGEDGSEEKLAATPISAIDSEKSSFLVDFKVALWGGGIAILVAIGGIFAVGQVGSAEARQLLNAMFPTTRFLCSAVMAGSATILALMLTVLSLTQNVDQSIKPKHYRRVRDIAFLDTLTFIGATLLLLFHSIPVQDSDQVPSTWYAAIYYVLLCWTALIGGMLITTMIMLYRTTVDMIYIVSGFTDHSLVKDEDDGEADSAEDEESEDHPDR